MHTPPLHLTRWRREENYLGPDYSDRYIAIARSRDADPLEVSNYETTKRLLALSDVAFDEVRIRHWACGWIDAIFIREDDEKGLAVADELAGRRAEYPVLDDEDLARREAEDEDVDEMNPPVLDDPTDIE